MKILPIACTSIAVVIAAVACGDTDGNPIIADAPGSGGTGSSGSSGTSSGSSGSSGSGGTSGTSGSSGIPDGGPAKEPVLVVASSLGVLAWKDAKGITAD